MLADVDLDQRFDQLTTALACPVPLREGLAVISEGAATLVTGTDGAGLTVVTAPVSRR